MTAVVFDLDGTLIDSAPDIHRCVNLMLATEGIAPLSLDCVRGFIGNGAPVLVTRVLEAVGLPAEERAVHAHLLSLFLGHYETAVALTRVYSGAAECLEHLHQSGTPLALCTNKPLAATQAVLSHFNLAKYFPVVVGGDSLPLRKPDPAPLLHSMKLLGAEAALFVGDSEVDAETALRARIPFALFTKGYRKKTVAELPHALAFDDFEALLAFLRVPV